VSTIAPITPLGAHWLCPCSAAQPHPRSTLTPVVTIVSLIEPACPFCGRKFRPGYRRDQTERKQA
jgi:hypothetical protein